MKWGTFTNSVFFVLLFTAPAVARPPKQCEVFRELQRHILEKRNAIPADVKHPELVWVGESDGRNERERNEIAETLRMTDALFHGVLPGPTRLELDVPFWRLDPENTNQEGNPTDRLNISVRPASITIKPSEEVGAQISVKVKGAKPIQIHEYAHTFFETGLIPTDTLNFFRTLHILTNGKAKNLSYYSAATEVLCDLVSVVQTGDPEAVVKALRFSGQDKEARRMIEARSFSRASTYPWTADDVHSSLSPLRAELGKYLPPKTASLADKQAFLKKVVTIFQAEIGSWREKPIGDEAPQAINDRFIARLKDLAR